MANKRSRRRVLVTGGAGFIGSQLCARLLAEGRQVTCVDNFFTGRHENLSPLIGHDDFQLINHDVTESFFVDVDEIHNLACPASPIHYQLDPVKTTRTSIIGTLNTLGIARRTGARLVLASTSEVYGDPTVHPQPESYFGNVNPIGPRSCYDEGKRCAETLMFDYRREYGMPVKIARIFNTYGPKMRRDDGRVISNFIVQALSGEAITLYGKGEQTRSFCYVDDMIDGLVALMATADDFTGPVNLGNPEEVTIQTLAERIIALTGSSADLIEKPRPDDDDPMRRCPDITLASKMLGWKPTVPLDLGLRRTIDYFRSQITA